MNDRDWEIYNKIRLVDLGFAGMTAKKQAEKVLQEYRDGWRGIIAFYSEPHRVMLAERVWRQAYWQSNVQNMHILPTPELRDAYERFNRELESVLAEPSCQVSLDSCRKVKIRRRRKGWKNVCKTGK